MTDNKNIIASFPGSPNVQKQKMYLADPLATMEGEMRGKVARFLRPLPLYTEGGGGPGISLSPHLQNFEVDIF